MSPERCGSTDTTSGDPCKWDESARGPCPYHDEDMDTPDTRNTLLEENPSITELVAGEIQNGATIPEACSEANISYNGQYKKWLARGKEDDAKEVFQTFRTEVRRARRRASKNERRMLKTMCADEGDTRTFWKIHREQYGDLYHDDMGEEADVAPIFSVPEEVAEEWRQVKQ